MDHAKELTERLRITYPIIQAPMAGGPTTPELVAAVSEAGGLGSIGAAYLTPDQISEDSARVREMTSKPFAINLFCGGYGEDLTVPPAILDALAEAYAELGLEAPAVPEIPGDPLAAQIEAVLDARPALFSFTFGIPGPDVIRRMQTAGIVVAGTATTVEEGRLLAEAGVEVVVAQGEEAGGHRGTFAVPFEDALVPTAELVAGLVGSLDLPVIASGGIMSGADARRALDLGAAAAQLGTAFLACPESGAAPAYKEALLNATADTTVITRAFSGRPARGLRNAFIERIEATGASIPSYPLQNLVTRPLRSAAAAQGRREFLSLWAGRGVTGIQAIPAAELVAEIAAAVADTETAAN